MAENSLLQVTLQHRIGGVNLYLAFTLTHPWTILFAPSGAGKSTVLRVIAGLLRPQAGQVLWTPPSGQQTVLTDTDTGIFIPPHRRAIPFVGQQPALFPHCTVLQNATYGLTRSDRSQNDPTRRTQHVEQILELCRIKHMAEKMPATLSGGERQRVAIARAIAPAGSRVLLLDEPFTGLDTAMREELLSDLKPWLAQRGIPVLQVTHDVGEVLALGAEVIKINDGQVVAQGPAPQVLRPEQEWLLEQLRSAHH